MIDVYAHTSPSGKQYVGIARRGWRVRWRSHTHAARYGSDTAFHRAIRKYGPDAFMHEILERMTTEAGAKRAEQLWIERLGSRTNGYNETAGGDGTHGLSARARAAIGAAHRGKAVSAETRARMSASALGMKRGPHSAEHRARISAAHAGKKLSEETKAKVRAANLGKKYGAETKRKHAEALRAQHASGARAHVGAKISAGKLASGYRHSEETRAKMRGPRRRP